jgi:hypothetical protein
MAIVHKEFAEACLEQALLFGVNPHYLVAIAHLLSEIDDGTQGNKVGPFRRDLDLVEWNANASEPAFEVVLKAKDIHEWEKQCIFAALQTFRAQKRLLTTLGRYPSPDELYAEWPKDPFPAGRTLKGALESTSGLMEPAVDAFFAGMDDGALVGDIKLDSIAPAKHDIAKLIIRAFADAEYGKLQQAAGLANAIAESNLNPNAVNNSLPEHSVGLFQLNINGGVGAGHTEAQLKDPAKNVELIIKEAKRNAPEFQAATTLHDAVAIFVRKVERPGNQPGEIIKRLAIAQKLVLPLM